VYFLHPKKPWDAQEGLPLKERLLVEEIALGA
jgi:CRISPR-associated protein Csm3